MTGHSLYKEVLLDHFRHPRNKGSLDGASIIRRGNNPRCGDEVAVGLFFNDKTIEQVRFQGRGCSICIASASLMSEAVRGSSQALVRELCEKVNDWFTNNTAPDAVPPLEILDALSAVRPNPARHRCALLPWEALIKALGGAIVP